MAKKRQSLYEIRTATDGLDHFLLAEDPDPAGDNSLPARPTARGPLRAVALFNSIEDGSGATGGNSAVSSNGDGDLNYLSGSGALNISAWPVSLSFWLKIDQGAITQNLAYLWTYNINSPTQMLSAGVYGVASGSSEGRVFTRYRNGATDTSTPSTSRVDDGNWHHVLIVWTATTVSIYIDGVSDITPAAHSTPFPAPTVLWIFRYNPTDGFDFPGILDEIAVYNVDISASAGTIYAGGQGLPWDHASQPAGRVHHWDLDSANWGLDRIGTYNLTENGTLVSATGIPVNAAGTVIVDQPGSYVICDTAAGGYTVELSDDLAKLPIDSEVSFLKEDDDGNIVIVEGGTLQIYSPRTNAPVDQIALIEGGDFIHLKRVAAGWYPLGFNLPPWVEYWYVPVNTLLPTTTGPLPLTFGSSPFGESLLWTQAGNVLTALHSVDLEISVHANLWIDLGSNNAAVRCVLDHTTNAVDKIAPRMWASQGAPRGESFPNTITGDAQIEMKAGETYQLDAQHIDIAGLNSSQLGSSIDGDSIGALVTIRAL